MVVFSQTVTPVREYGVLRNFSKSLIIVKYILYSILGGLFGLLVGGIFGLMFDSFYTEKSQLVTKQYIQVILFGCIGTIAGAGIGFKIASEEQGRKKKEIEYKKSLVTKACAYCSQEFQYSTLEFTDQKYCNSCINSIRKDYVAKCKEINRIVDGIDKLKRHSTIHVRLDKVQQIAESMKHYEQTNLDFITKKPSEILRSISEYRSNLG
jgi:hypothetical protein